MHGMAWHGMAWHGMAWHGMAWHGMQLPTNVNIVTKKSCVLVRFLQITGSATSKKPQHWPGEHSFIQTTYHSFIQTTYPKPKSAQPHKIKQRLFITSVELVFPCGCEYWTMTKTLKTIRRVMHKNDMSCYQHTQAATSD